MGKRTFFRECPLCGALLDPDELCTCEKEKAQKQNQKPQAEEIGDASFYERLEENYSAG